jgi:ABC-type antimicrobial peptide transport system ATPase subunit
MIFQEPMTSLNPVLTIGRQITETIEQHRGADRAAAQKRAVELLGLVGIADPVRRLKQYPHQLSGGMRQRIMIAIALACDPNVWCGRALQEAFVGLSACGLASMYPASGWSMWCSGPPWISARIRSH